MDERKSRSKDSPLETHWAQSCRWFGAELGEELCEDNRRVLGLVEGEIVGHPVDSTEGLTDGAADGAAKGLSEGEIRKAMHWEHHLGNPKDWQKALSNAKHYTRHLENGKEIQTDW